MTWSLWDLYSIMNHSTYTKYAPDFLICYSMIIHFEASVVAFDILQWFDPFKIVRMWIRESWSCFVLMIISHVQLIKEMYDLDEITHICTITAFYIIVTITIIIFIIIHFTNNLLHWFAGIIYYALTQTNWTQLWVNMYLHYLLILLITYLQFIFFM